MKIFDALSRPKNYGDMLKKICGFNIVLLSIYFVLFYFLSNDFNGLVNKILNIFINKIEITRLSDIKLFGASIVKFLDILFLITLALLISVIERIFRIHNLLSDILKIRKNFDTKYIIKNIIEKIGLNIDNDTIENKRKEIMRNIFYEYVSSFDPKIDRHNIEEALDYWTYFWVLLDSIFFLVFFIFISLVFQNFYLFLIYFLIIIIFSLVDYFYLYRIRCKEKANEEVNEILHDKKRKKEIRKYLNAL